MTPICFALVLTIPLAHCLATSKFQLVRQLDSQITLPNSQSVWHTGYKQMIAWNGSYVRQDGLYYNNQTRVTIGVYLMPNETRSGRLELVSRIIENFPLTAASLFWSLPYNLSQLNAQLAKNVSQSQYHYQLQLYPSFFDWPQTQCKGCMQSVMSSEPFVISQQTTCKDCGAVVDPASPGLDVPHQYEVAVKSVIIGVAVVFAVVALVSILMYSKRGVRSLKQYRRRQTGMIYRYKPPAVAELQTEDKSYFPSPLRQFFSTDTVGVTGGGTATVGNSPQRQTSLANLSDKIIRDATAASQLSEYSLFSGQLNNINNDQLDQRTVLDLPPSPPQLYARQYMHQQSQSSVATNLRAGTSHLFESVSNASDQRPTLRNADAVLIGTQFRHALRVTDADSLSSSSLASSSSHFDSATSFAESVSTQFDTPLSGMHDTGRASRQPSLDVPTPPQGSVPRHVTDVLPESSPVLGRLAAQVRRDDQQEL